MSEPVIIEGLREPPAAKAKISLSSGRSRLQHQLLDRPSFVPISAIVLVVLLGNLVYLIHVFDQSPIDWLSGLTNSGKPGLTLGQDTIDPGVGWISQALGHRAALDLLHGVMPWWDPFEGLGLPFAGDLQSSALFPLTLLLVFADGQIYLHITLELIGGISTYLLVRRYTLTSSAATAAGIFYALNGTFSWLGHAAVDPVPFLPVMLLGIELAADAARDRRYAGWALIAIGLAMSIYGGFPETTYWQLWLIGPWMCYKLLQIGPRSRLRLLAKAATGAFVGLLLAAPLVIAFHAYLPYADNSQYTPSDAFSVAPAHYLSTFVLPYIFGPIGGFSAYDKSGVIASVWNSAGGYFGTSLIMLAIVGAVGRRHRRLRLLLVAWLLIAACKTIGFPPVMHIASWFPYGWVNWSRFSPATSELIVAILAGFGVDDLVTRDRVFRLRAVAASLAVAFVAAAGIYAYPILKKVDGAPHLRVWTFGSVAWGCGIVIALMIASGLRRHRGRAILVIVAIDTLALFVTPMLASLRSATIDVAPVTFLQKNLGPDRYFTLGPIAPDYSAYFGIDAINSNDNPVAKNWNTYVGTHLAPYATAYEFTGTAFWQTQQAYGSNIKDKKDLLTPDQEFELYLPNYETDGVKYIIVSTSDDPIGPAKIAGIHKVFGDPSFTIYQLPHVSPIVETLGSSCTTKSLSANSVLAYCRGPATLIRHDLYIPGWSAQVNGVGTTVSPYQSVFQSIRLGRGRSMVTFGYEPSGRSLGFGAFFAGILFLLFSLAVATGVVHRLKRRVPVAPHARSQATS